MRALIVSLIGSIAVACAAAAQDAPAAGDLAAIRATIEAYAEGYRRGDRDLQERAFDAERGHFKSIVKVDDGPDRVRVTPIPEWIDKVTNRENPEPLDVEVRILSITTVNEHIANVFLDFNDSLFDMMLVAKIDGEWRILNKISIYQDPDAR